MPEGLSPTEAGKELAEHVEREKGHDETVTESRSHRRISIIEASLLAVVAVLAAYSGWAAAKWSTDSSLSLARASAARAESNAASIEALNDLNFDLSSFNTWVTAYLAHDKTAVRLAERRFTPNFRRAFNAWLSTHPETNPNAPRGPTYMPEYKRPERAHAAALSAKASAEYSAGEHAGSTSDSYVRTTVYLATVLFLAGLGGHFAYIRIRYGLATVGSLILLLALILLVTSPKPF